MTETERQDWSRFRKSGDVDARNRLVERHLALVHHFAHRMRPQSGGLLESGDLVSAGTMGLMDAVGAYDPERGYRFSTFAASRIRGAILDEMRRRDVAPRSVRRKQRRMEDARDRLAVELNRSPGHPELARRLGVDARTLWRWKWDVERSRRVSLQDLAREEHGGERRPGGPTAPPAALVDEGEGEVGAVEERLTREAELSRLHRELATLSERERLVVRLYDLESHTLREIADRLGVSESRISQIRSRALGRLRERLRDLRDAA